VAGGGHGTGPQDPDRRPRDRLPLGVFTKERGEVDVVHSTRLNT